SAFLRADLPRECHSVAGNHRGQSIRSARDRPGRQHPSLDLLRACSYSRDEVPPRRAAPRGRSLRMATKVGVGYSENAKSFDAGVEAARAATTDADARACDLVLMYSTEKHEP